MSAEAGFEDILQSSQLMASGVRDAMLQNQEMLTDFDIKLDPTRGIEGMAFAKAMQMFDFLGYNPKIQLVIVGSNDDIAGCEAVERMAPTWNPDAAFHIIRGADHFYWGKEEEIRAVIREFLDKA